ncbi:MAG: two-component system response regulator [Gammaproteobacteria bacterium]
MSATKYPYAVRLMGFDAVERAEISEALLFAPPNGPSYSCLLDASLEEPDICVCNGDNVKAVAELNAVNIGPLCPVLVIGRGLADMPHSKLARPLDRQVLCARMAELVVKRNQALDALPAGTMPAVPERRRKPRLDFDLTDPAEYAAQRRAPQEGAVLIVDQRPALREHLARLLGPRSRPVEYIDNAGAAVKLCTDTAVALVLVNTSMPGLDPYQLCADIKASPKGERIAVVLLVGPSFPYDEGRGRTARVRGTLDKPVRDRNLLCAVKKLLSIPT